LVTHLGYTWAE